MCAKLVQINNKKVNFIVVFYSVHICFCYNRPKILINNYSDNNNILTVLDLK